MPRAVKRENIIEEELVRRVRAAGGIAEKTTVIGRRGFFDRVIVLPGGAVIFCECKRPKGGVLSPHQILRIKQYRSLGAAVAVVCNSEDITRLLAKN